MRQWHISVSCVVTLFFFCLYSFVLFNDALSRSDGVEVINWMMWIKDSKECGRKKVLDSVKLVSRNFCGRTENSRKNPQDIRYRSRYPNWLFHHTQIPHFAARAILLDDMTYVIGSVPLCMHVYVRQFSSPVFVLNWVRPTKHTIL